MPKSIRLPATSSEGPQTGQTQSPPFLPTLDDEEILRDVVCKLSKYFVDAIEAPHTFEQLRTAAVGHILKPLIVALSDRSQSSHIVTALLILKWHFASTGDDRGVNEARGYACEIVAWRTLHHSSEQGLIDSLLHELPAANLPPERPSDVEANVSNGLDYRRPPLGDLVDEHSSLLSEQHVSLREHTRLQQPESHYTTHKQRSSDGLQISFEEDPTLPFVGLNALEIAAIADAKKFLSHPVVQKIINGIWLVLSGLSLIDAYIIQSHCIYPGSSLIFFPFVSSFIGLLACCLIDQERNAYPEITIRSGDIVFWESLSVHTKKKAQLYCKRRADPFSRLRVPKYQKVFEALFFAIFLGLYYAVLVERNPRNITVVEVLLYLWIAAFAYEEFGEFKDAGTLFYAADFWSLWDIGIIGVGAAYLISRIVGLVRDSDQIIDISFDILSLEALFLVPRVCSLLSLHPYFGTLIPCLKEMANYIFKNQTKDFIKFLGIVIILFLGFLTTFTMLARDSSYGTARQIWWIMIYVFFGSSYLGFDIASEISPALGPTLMVCFVVLTNILLLTSLIAILSQSLTKVMDHAREEYLFQYSVFVLEASASRRLTYYLPPLNLIPLVLFRPLRLFMPAGNLRSARIVLLKITHLPYVGAIWAYEAAAQRFNGRSDSWRYTLQSHKRPLLSGQTNSLHRISRYSALRNQSEGSLLPKTPINESRTPGVKENDTVVELEHIWCDGNKLYGRIKQGSMD